MEMQEEVLDTNPLTIRFNEAPWYGSNTRVLLGGAGGIGSWTTLLLARTGIKTLVVDFDVIELHNIGGQLFSKDSVGKKKVEAIKDIADIFAGEGNVRPMDGRYGPDSFSHDFVISAFDNMAARKDMFENWVKYVETKGSQNTAIFLDGRMTMESIQVFAVTYDKVDRYREFLFSDDEVEELRCNAKATSHFGAMIASIIVSNFTNHLANINYYNGPARVVPFFTSYEGPIAYFKQEE